MIFFGVPYPYFQKKKTQIARCPEALIFSERCSDMVWQLVISQLRPGTGDGSQILLAR